MSNLYKVNFIPSNTFRNYMTQNQIGFNVNVDSYLLMYDKYFYVNDDFNQYLNNNSPQIYFKGIDYINGKPSNESLTKYNNYKVNIYEHTIKIERLTPRLDGFDFTIPTIKNGYNINGKSYVNVIVLFGNNYYTDENYINKNLKMIGYLYFENDNIPLYNTRDYGVQINSLLKISLNLIDGNFSYIEYNPINIRTYYNGEISKGINIMNNIILK